MRVDPCGAGREKDALKWFDSVDYSLHTMTDRSGLGGNRVPLLACFVRRKDDQMGL
jgi:hypothetical protein